MRAQMLAQIAEEKSHLHSFELAPSSTGSPVPKIRICGGPMPEAKASAANAIPPGPAPMMIRSSMIGAALSSRCLISSERHHSTGVLPLGLFVEDRWLKRLPTELSAIMPPPLAHLL